MQCAWTEERPHLKVLATKVQSLLEFADEMWRRGKANGDGVEYERFEEDVAQRSAEIERAVHEVALSGLDVDAPFVCVWGKTYRRVHRIQREYGTLAGNVPVTRTLYREVGTRSGPALDPVAQRAGVIDGSWLPRTARAMAHLLAQGTSREAHATSEELLRLPYSRSSFERVGHEVGKQYIQRRRQIEPLLIRTLEIPVATRSLSVSVDRVAVPMEEPIDEPKKGKPPKHLRAFRDAARRHLKSQVSERTLAIIEEAVRAAKASKKRKVNRNYRMAYCGTVTLHDAKGRALHTIRYGRMPPVPGSIAHLTHREAHSLMQRLKEDVCALRERRPELSVVLLADGAPELWNLFSQYLNARTLGVEPVQRVDAWHVLEYAAAAAQHNRPKRAFQNLQTAAHLPA